jgi:hypothetical protein
MPKDYGNKNISDRCTRLASCESEFVNMQIETETTQQSKTPAFAHVNVIAAQTISPIII